jgi:hypothetical protein
MHSAEAGWTGVRNVIRKDPSGVFSLNLEVLPATCRALSASANQPTAFGSTMTPERP